ncbi:ORF01R [Marbled eel polyomavirus]|uniref:ORF01R n=1 Tax=Marbled eel polyomavirus TaxID=1662286 RepID=UPI0007C1F172|nr:ORF01R [Marbled eel polyomavirus]ANC70190.1 ORF01R [Marbled eel polyomavirus]
MQPVQHRICTWNKTTENNEQCCVCSKPYSKSPETKVESQVAVPFQVLAEMSQLQVVMLGWLRSSLREVSLNHSLWAGEKEAGMGMWAKVSQTHCSLAPVKKAGLENGAGKSSLAPHPLPATPPPPRH